MCTEMPQLSITDMPFAGTGLFVGSADALQNGGPIGALLAYSLMGTVVYCLCVSVGEIISFLYV
jgi:amino acid transporter